MLEQLRRAKEQSCGLLGAERLADIEEIDDAREQRSTLAGAYGGFIEDAGFLDGGGFIVVVSAEAALLVLFRCKRHSEKRKAETSAPNSTTWKEVCCRTLSGAHTSSQLTATRGPSLRAHISSFHNFRLSSNRPNSGLNRQTSSMHSDKKLTLQI